MRRVSRQRRPDAGAGPAIELLNTTVVFWIGDGSRKRQTCDQIHTMTWRHSTCKCVVQEKAVACECLAGLGGERALSVPQLSEIAPARTVGQTDPSGASSVDVKDT